MGVIFLILLIGTGLGWLIGFWLKATLLGLAIGAAAGLLGSLIAWAARRATV
jgi:hypothetical protein